MKILSIRIKNLASLAGEHFIDFEAEPLASAGLVAIVGKTGAGKSTILDAMCLALFNKIPRLKDSDGKLQDVDGSELLTNSPLTVLRRGTGIGFAELRFVAQDQKHYLARWEIKRARENATAKLQSVQRYLKCETDSIVIADKTKAVDSAIHKITQLSFEQFTRAVLLAQSEVTAFLKARDNERGELLEYLTNSSVFGKIGQLAFEKTKAISIQRKELENYLGHLEILSDEAAQQLMQQFETAQREYKKLDTEKQNLAQQQQWFESKQKLDLQIAEKEKICAAQTLIQQQLLPQRQQLIRLETFSTIRPAVTQQQQLQQSLERLRPQLQQTQNNFDQLQQQFNSEKAHYQSAEINLKTLQNFELEHAQSLSLIRQCIVERDLIGQEFNKLKNQIAQLNIEHEPLLEKHRLLAQQLQQNQLELSSLEQQLVNSAQFEPLDSGIQTHIQQLQQFSQQYQLVQENLGNIEQAKVDLSTLKKQLNELSSDYGSQAQIELKLSQVRSTREQNLSALNQLDSIQQKLNQYFDLVHENKMQQQKSETLAIEFEQLETAQRAAEQSFQTAKSERINIEKLLQQQRLIHAENVEQLRESLVAHEPCSVCGSPDHPYKQNDSQVSKVLFELQQQQEKQALSKEHELFAQWQNSLKHSMQIQSELNQSKKILTLNKDKLEGYQKQFVSLFHDLKIKLSFDSSQQDIESTISKVIEQNQQEKSALEQQLIQLEQSLKQQNQYTNQIQNIEYQLNHEMSLRQNIQQVIDCLNATEQQQWLTEALNTTTQIRSQLQNRAEKLLNKAQLNHEINQKIQQLTLLTQQLNQQKLTLSNTEKARDEYFAQGQSNAQKASQTIQKITGLIDAKPHEWLTEHDSQRQQLQSHYQTLKQQFEQSRISFEKHQTELQNLQIQHNQIQSNLLNYTHEIKHWLEHQPDFTQIDLNQLLQINQSQEKQLREQIQLADQQRNETRSALKTIQEQLTVHLQQQPELQYEPLKVMIVEKQQALSSQLEILDKLKVDLARHQEALSKQAKYAEQIQTIQLEEHRWGKISGLMGDANGKKFRDYAQQYNLDILLEHANQQLSMLSQRYTLKRLANSLSLAIVDHDMDGETRSVASLSGGESFLTSLALSLAIANMASGSMKIESLFIDEGFGTLDASSLHMVMNALDQLQHQGRKVVLISHIQEMHERIPVQIQVQPLGAGASTIQVVG